MARITVILSTVVLLAGCGAGTVPPTSSVTPPTTTPEATSSPAEPTIPPAPSPTPTAAATATQTPESPTAIDHSPGTGPWILYQAVYGDVVDVGLVRPDGSDAHRIDGAPGNRWHPDWSPDGTRIAYDYELANGLGQIGLINVDGAPDEVPIECVAPCLGLAGPAWSPDGRFIGYEIWDGPDGDRDVEACYLALLEVATGEVRRIIEWAGCDQNESADDRPLSEGIRMRFSPDGERIVFQGEGPRNEWAIFTATVDGEDVQQLTEWGLGVRPDWSPDGEWIVFHSEEPAHENRREVSLYRVRPDGTDLQRLTAPGGTITDVYARYLPDGSGILFSRCLSLWVCETRMIDPDGSNDRLLFGELGSQTVHMMLQPAGATPEPDALRLVAVGDSIPYNAPYDCPGCTSFVDRYAEAVSAASGRPVEASNLSEHTGLSLPQLLAELDSLAPRLAEADVIVVGIAHNSVELNADEPCGAPLLEGDIPDWDAIDEECALEAAERYRQQFEELYSRIAAIREGQPTILRTVNRYNDWIGWAPGNMSAEDEAKAKLVVDHWNAVLCEAAEQNDFGCADIYQAFNGPDGLTPAGDQLAADHNHPSDRGNQLIAEELAKLGFAPLAGP